MCRNIKYFLWPVIVKHFADKTTMSLCSYCRAELQKHLWEENDIKTIDWSV